MLYNDLSNKSAPVLAFNFERVVCDVYEPRILFPKYELNRQRIDSINQLYWKDFSIFYVTFVYPKRKLDSLEDELDEYGCMFNGTLKVGDKRSLLFWLRQQSTCWYFDTDEDVVNSVHPFGQLWDETFTSIWRH